jgi:hypothetical protein
MPRHGRFPAQRKILSSPLIAVLVLLISLLTVPSIGQAYSDNDSCPDDLANEGESIDYTLEDQPFQSVPDLSLSN